MHECNYLLSELLRNEGAADILTVLIQRLLELHRPHVFMCPRFTLNKSGILCMFQSLETSVGS